MHVVQLAYQRLKGLRAICEHALRFVTSRHRVARPLFTPSHSSNLETGSLRICATVHHRATFGFPSLHRLDIRAIEVQVGCSR